MTCEKSALEQPGEHVLARAKILMFLWWNKNHARPLRGSCKIKPLTTEIRWQNILNYRIYIRKKKKKKSDNLLERKKKRKKNEEGKETS